MDEVTFFLAFSHTGWLDFVLWMCLMTEVGRRLMFGLLLGPGGIICKEKRKKMTCIYDYW